MVWLIVGLGNPGKKYEMSRHNTGFLVVDRFAEKEKIIFGKKEGGALTGKGVVRGKLVVLAKPMTYMNRSGSAVRQLLKRWDACLDHLLVIHDDLDLDYGRIRIKKGGGHGGHRGVESIIESLGNDDFLRLRVGIGRPEDPEQVAQYVLEPFPPHDLRLLEEHIELAREAVRDIILLGVARTMNKYN